MDEWMALRRATEMGVRRLLGTLTLFRTVQMNYQLNPCRKVAVLPVLSGAIRCLAG